MRATREPHDETDEDLPENAAQSEPPAVVLLIAALLGAVAIRQLWAAIGAWRLAAEDGAWMLAALVSASALFVLVAALGLWRLRPWGWWAACVLIGAGAALNLKFLIYYLTHLRWDHPRAGAALGKIALEYGLPALVALVILALLWLPSVRIALGIKDRPRPVRRRIVAARAPRSG